MNRFNCAVGGQAQTDAAAVDIFWEVYANLSWRLMLCWKHCSPTCQFSFIYNHQPGNTPINGLSLAGLWGLSKSCIMLSSITEIMTENKQVQTLTVSIFRWKNESLHPHHWSLNLKISTGFGVLGKPYPCREGVPAGGLMLFCLFISLFLLV